MTFFLSIWTPYTSFFAYFYKKVRKKARRLVQHHTVTHINAV
jgi:hypothetical protein